MKQTVWIRTDKAASDKTRGQAVLVLNAITEHPEGITAEDITTDIVANGLVTRQEPSRITAYYLSMFKKQGLVVAEVVETDNAEAGDNVEDKVDETEEVLG